ncbi:ABC transporter permease [Embleya sp. AB8]|uniref:ABC transporter permease n=1 Tax=Embleya sp. AB8 TaxID=3156304 RepID=UPI003C77B0F7
MTTTAPTPTSEQAPPDRSERTRRSTFANEARAVRVVWHRELIRFRRARVQLAVTLAQPILYLLVMGPGLASLAPGRTGYNAFLFPGVLIMTVQGTAVATGASIPWDREAGLLREMLVAPVHRASLLLGKCLGGATVATCQGALVLALAGAAHIPYHPALLATLLAETALAALAFTALVTVAAVTVTRTATFNATLGIGLMPMFMFSGAMFPITALPTWLAPAALLNPMTYAIDPLRRAIAAHVTTLDPGTGPRWAGHPLPIGLELATLTALATLTLTIAAHRFARVR